MKTQFVFLISKAVLQSIRVIFRVNKYTHGNPWQMFNSKFKSYHFCCLTLVYAHSSCSIFLILAVCSTPSAYLSNIWLIAARQRVSDFEMRKSCSSSLNSHLRLGVFFVVIFFNTFLTYTCFRLSYEIMIYNKLMADFCAFLELTGSLF